MNGGKDISQFFSKRDIHHQTSSTPDHGLPSLAQQDGRSAEITADSCLGPQSRDRPSGGKVQASLKELFHPKGPVVTVETNAGASSGAFVDPVHADLDRRKRRRISVVADAVNNTDAPSVDDGALEAPLHSPAAKQKPSPYPSPQPSQATDATHVGEPKTPPKKMLRLSSGGKFRSPPTKTCKSTDLPATPPKKRGRPRKADKAAREGRLMARIAYSVESEIGSRIERILAGQERHMQSNGRLKEQRSTPRRRGPAKPTHPFFGGQQKGSEVQEKQATPRRASAVTPGKLRAQTMAERGATAVHEVKDTYSSSLLKDRLIAKHPGAQDPSWPSPGLSHIRGLESADHKAFGRLATPGVDVHERKRKTAERRFPAAESVLEIYASHLRPESEGRLRPDGFRDPHPSLAVPTRLLLSGPDIVERLRTELSPASLAGASQPCHAAIAHLLRALPTALSSFDKDGGENTAWAQKYAPTTTAEVLQQGQEMHVLKDWLSSLTVTAVENASRIEAKLAQKKDVKPKKRNTKYDEMDDFIVDEDEDNDDMEALAPLDEPSSSADSRAQRSFARNLKTGSKTRNAILLSGPHGCGKSASAYAAAKELGFKVFEINSGERRSGKDVLDKVGDMTENHIVRHHGSEPADLSTAEVSAAEEPHRNDEAFERDLATGRQGKMSAFFKPKQPAVARQPPKTKITKLRDLETIQQALKKPAKDQQQSLILLEEVDVLFKEDKDFWTTVLRLIVTSRRPFIMTCNDESLVPRDDNLLQGILRLAPPPNDLASDYMLLVAATEGHVLQRRAVTTLYESRGRNLRSSLAQLQFWCQIGLGDPRSGLSWIYQRWPPGSDRDERGQVLRVVSEHTYREGMGFLPTAGLDEVSQLVWAGQEYGLDTSEVLGWPTIDEHAAAATSLARFLSIADSLSAMDVYASSRTSVRMDYTQKSMGHKARQQYIEGMTLLQTDECPAYDNLSRELGITASLAAFHAANFLDSRDLHHKLQSTIASPTRHNDVDAVRLTRHDFMCLDPIAVGDDSVFLGSAAGGLTQSVLDGPFAQLVADVAPYVRSILHHEVALGEQRDRMSSILLGHEGRGNARGRTTRAARSALEGSQRATTRRERWFASDLDVAAILATGCPDWPTMAEVDEQSIATRSEIVEAPHLSGESTELEVNVTELRTEDGV